MGIFKPHLQGVSATCLWESPRFIIICDVIEWNEPGLWNGAICPERSAYAVLPSASCRGHQRMHHQRRKKWTRATRTTTMSKRWDYFHNSFPLRADPISRISSTKTPANRSICVGHVFYFIWLSLLVLVVVLLAVLLSIASARVAFIPQINVFQSSIWHPSLEIIQKKYTKHFTIFYLKLYSASENVFFLYFNGNVFCVFFFIFVCPFTKSRSSYMGQDLFYQTSKSAQSLEPSPPSPLLQFPIFHCYQFHKPILVWNNTKGCMDTLKWTIFHCLGKVCGQVAASTTNSLNNITILQ